MPVPSRFGTEVVARLLGLRLNHPAAQDFLELRPQDPATRAEAAYSAAQILGFGPLADSWQIAQVKSLAASFTLPQLNDVAAPDPHRRVLEDRDAVRLGRDERRHGDRLRRHRARRLRLLGLRLARLQAPELPERGNPRLDAAGPDDVHDERRGPEARSGSRSRSCSPRTSSSSARTAPTRRDRRSSTRRSTSATAGSSSRPTKASPSLSSAAGTGRSSPGAAGRCARPGSSPRARPQLPRSSDAATPFG